VWLDEAEIRPGRSIRGAVDAGRDSSTLTPRADSGEPRAQQMSVGHRAVDEPLESPVNSRRSALGYRRHGLRDRSCAWRCWL